jgi:hypothetical protein
MIPPLKLVPNGAVKYKGKWVQAYKIERDI